MCVQLRKEGNIQGDFNGIFRRSSQIFFVEQLRILGKGNGCCQHTVVTQISGCKIEGHAEIVDGPAKAVIGSVGEIILNGSFGVKITCPHGSGKLCFHRLRQVVIDGYHLIQHQLPAALGVVIGSVKDSVVFDLTVV